MDLKQTIIKYYNELQQEYFEKLFLTAGASKTLIAHCFIYQFLFIPFRKSWKRLKKNLEQGILQAADAATFFRHSGLQEKELKRIWELAAFKKERFMVREGNLEFSIFLWSALDTSSKAKLHVVSNLICSCCSEFTLACKFIGLEQSSKLISSNKSNNDLLNKANEIIRKKNDLTKLITKETYIFRFSIPEIWQNTCSLVSDDNWNHAKVGRLFCNCRSRQNRLHIRYGNQKTAPP